MSKPPSRKKSGGTILLKDLVPRADPKGGAGGKTVFGQLPNVSGPDDHQKATPEKPPRRAERAERPKREK